MYVESSLRQLHQDSTLNTMAASPPIQEYQHNDHMKKKKVLVPVAQGTEAVEAVGIIDVLRCAGAHVIVASVRKGKDRVVELTGGIQLVADALISDFNCATSSFHLIALPGGVQGTLFLRDCAELKALMKHHASNGGLYGAICAAPSIVLSAWGLLDGRRATGHPYFMDNFPPQVTPLQERVVVDGTVVTSRGHGTTLEFSLALVKQLYGNHKADKVAVPLLMRPHHGVPFTFKELNPIAWNSNRIPQIMVPVANGTEDIEAAFIIYILRRAGANVIVASLENNLQVVASKEVKFIADALLDEVHKLDFDLIVLPGGLGGAQTYANSEKLISLLRRQVESNKLYAAIGDSPAIVLEPHGLLKGKKATCYPPMFEKLSDKSENNNRVVVDGNLMTSQGPGTAMEFALSIVEKFFGPNKALDLAKMMVFI